MRRPLRRTEPSGPVLKREPWMGLPRDVTAMPPFDEADRGALMALRDGRAAEHEQKRALGWIMFACGWNDRLYRPGSPDVRDFVLGRHSVAEAIAAVLATPSRKTENEHA